MIQIQFTKGCPNQCEYCYETAEMEYLDPKIPEGKEVQIKDMNFLGVITKLFNKEKCKEILRSLPKKKWEFICGIDFRYLDQEICDLMKQKGFIKVRWAWDYEFSQQKIHQKVWRMFKKAGYRSEDLSVFMLVNWKIPFIECEKKLRLLLAWNVKVNDCCYDGGYPKSEIDFNNNKRFNGKRFWKYPDIKKFGMTYSQNKSD